jgi:hypothetical protein
VPAFWRTLIARARTPPTAAAFAALAAFVALAAVLAVPALAALGTCPSEDSFTSAPRTSSLRKSLLVT